MTHNLEALRVAKAFDTCDGRGIIQHQHDSSAHEAATTPTFKTNFPMPLTTLIGRKAEVASAYAFLRRSDIRLLTLSGPGGVGKTRLAFEVAREMQSDFADGVFLVLLAPIRDAQFVIPAIAEALEAQESAGQSLLQCVINSLLGKRVLLLLDNFEQVVAAAPQLVTLLEACHQLKILVTSREVLRVRGEQAFIVPSLALPDLEHAADSQSLSAVAAVALFIQRAQAARADFQLTAANAQVIAEICIRLDGLPLALELAAARLKLLSPQALLARLDHRLQVLTRGAREVAERHQTLRKTLQWSYDLLSLEEQVIFRSLAVFRGSWTLAATFAVCATNGGDGIEVEEVLASLIDKSLVRMHAQTDGDARFSLLEMIREYGWECLEQHCETEHLRGAHAAYYLSLAEQSMEELDGPRQAEYLNLLEQEHDNMRDALQWALEQAKVELALRLSNALLTFWSVRCFWSEGRAFLERALAISAGETSSARASALLALSVLLFYQNDYEQAEKVAEASLALYRLLEGATGVARALNTLGPIVANLGNYIKARALTEESLALARKMGGKARIAKSLTNLGRMNSIQGEYSRGRALLEEALAIQRELKNTGDIARSLYCLAWALVVSQQEPDTARAFLAESLLLARASGDKELVADCLSTSAQLALSQGDTPLARSLLRENLALSREIKNLWTTGRAIYTLAKVAVVEADFPTALALFVECLELCQEVGDRELIALCLEGLANVFAAQGESAWSAQLSGMAAALRERLCIPITPLDRPAYERMRTTARLQLGEAAFDAAWNQGRTMTLEQVLTAKVPLLASAQNTRQATSITSSLLSTTHLQDLSEREIEVLRLVAQGLTNLQIAEQLIISPHTVHSHVHSTLNKLDLTSRSAIVRFAFEHNLA